MTDLELLRHLAALMGWEVYTEQAGDYDQWQRRLVKEGGAGSCFIDLDGRVWIYDNPALYINAHERLWKPLHSMDDALMIMHHFEAAGCAAWVECDGHTGRGGVTTGAGRFEAGADTEARAFCYAALKSRGMDVTGEEGR